MRARLGLVCLVTLGLWSVPGLPVPAQDEYYDEELPDEDVGDLTPSLPLAPIEGSTDVPASGLEGGSVGYELSLAMGSTLYLGRTERFAGVAYQVRRPLGLRATRGLNVEVLLIARTAEASEDRPAGPFEIRARASTTSGASGEFTIDLAVPDTTLIDPHVVWRVGRAGQPARRWVGSVYVARSNDVVLLTDRYLYEPGETVHGWTRMRDPESHRPISGRPVSAGLTDGISWLATAELATAESGAATFDFPLPNSLASGNYTLHILEGEATLTTRTIVLGERHLERMRISVGLDSHLVGPGEQVTGMVQVVAADSTPIADALVTLQQDDGVPQDLSTDANGQARFSVAAPSYLSGDSAVHTLTLTASHGAHGSATQSERYTVSRTPYFVDLNPESGALLVEAETELYVSVTNALGEPARAGLVVELVGPAIVGGRTRVTTDAHGLGVARARVPRTAVSRTSGGECAEESSTEIVATVQATGRSPREARLCVVVGTNTRVIPHVDRPVIAPGARIDVRLARAGQRTPVLVALMQAGRVRTSLFVPASQDRVSIDVPSAANGLLWVEARPLASDDARSAIDARGATWVGTGAAAYLIVRPDDAFAVSLTTDQPSYVVRQGVEARIALDRPPAERAWATLVVRDEAWHAGEEDYALYSWTEDLREMVQTGAPEHELALRWALIAYGAGSHDVRGRSPMVFPPWSPYDELGEAPAEDVPYDAIDTRELVFRQYLPAAAQALEAFLGARDEYDAESVAGIIDARSGRTRFATRAFERLEELGLGGEPMVGLGGLPITPADIEQAGIGFSFDIAAGRVARSRLVRLLSVLALVGSTNDPTIARIFSVEPPERWLALAVHYGFTTAEAIQDPWGRPFVFRRTTGRSPTVVISERAPDWEVVSAGPDGRFGTGDDVRDPFARVVPEGTLYAETSGENLLIAELSRIAPGPGALSRMMAAYDELGLAAADELVPAAVFAYASEEYTEGEEYNDGYGEGTIGLGNMGTIGHGSGGGGGYGYGSGAGGFSGRASSVPRVRMGAAVAVAASALARIVREDFPATLTFVGEIALDASGQATVDFTLADAVTTYRIETIAWSATGWQSSAMARITVDQPIQIDAPIPETVREGDALVIPLRIVNHGREAARIVPTVTVEGDLEVDVSAPEEVEVPPLDGVAVRLTVRTRGVSQGSVRIEALDADGTLLDAVRRPLRVVPDARRVATRVESLLEADRAATLSAPAHAISGTAELRLWLTSAVFGAPPGDATGSLVYAWQSAVRAAPLDLEHVARLIDSFDALPALRPHDLIPTGHDPSYLGLLVGAGWTVPAISDARMSALLREITDRMGTHPSGPGDVVGALIGLAPAFAHGRSARPALEADLVAVAQLLRDRSADAGATASDAPEIWARVAAGMALAAAGGERGDDRRIVEMLRRLERHIIRLAARNGTAELAWLEAGEDDGAAGPRMAPTAWLALTHLLRGDRAAALPLARSLVAQRLGMPTPDRMIAALVLELLGGSPPASEIALTLDGAPLELGVDGTSFALATFGGGEHVLSARLPDGALAFASLTSEHLVGWEHEPARPLHVEVAWAGEVGARDTRTALWLEVRNRSPRVLVQPVVEIQLPTGAELDTEARAWLGRAGNVAVLADAVRISLPPLRVGGVMAIPLRARLTVAGTLRGLGVSVHDARVLPGAGLGEGTGGAEVATVLASRAVEVPEEGPEPEMAERASSGPPEPVPAPFDPLPRELVYDLAGL